MRLPPKPRPPDPLAKLLSCPVYAELPRALLPHAQAVPLGVMCEPPHGVPEMEPVLDAVAALNRDLFAIVEQDLYPCDPDVPLPIATRTREFLGQCGLGPGPREG